MHSPTFIQRIATIERNVITTTCRYFLYLSRWLFISTLSFSISASLFFISNALMICHPTAKVTKIPTIVTITPMKVSRDTSASETLQKINNRAITNIPTTANNRNMILRFFSS